MSSEERSLRVSVRSKRGLFLLTRSRWNVIQRQSVSALISAEQQQPLLGPNPPEALIVPRPTVCYLLFKKCIPACAWGKYFWNILEASGMDKCFQHRRPLLLDFCFWGGVWFVFCWGFFCHELLHMLSRPPAKPNETQTQPPGLRAT